ncbi:MAG: acyl-CoA dehydratase activase [Desulfobulbaceae bacterium]|jgi:predicted CoA-substrate-specific enzyme activase|nr:acyl-CoA dehydratase activase [Desulfobulbaceae bacterium]
MSYFAGIDIGSTSIKIALCDEEGSLAAHATCPTGSHFHQNAKTAFTDLLTRESIQREEVSYVMATGYGRKLYREADDIISEITANCIGATQIGLENVEIRTIINIGGQDLKVISLDTDGHVKNFAMNDKCAAGTGRFLEMTARNMEMDVMELGDCHLSAAGPPITINSTCTVFAESEIISLLGNGHGQPEIIAGIHYSIARRVARLAKRVGVEETVFFDGGPALNRGLVEALENELMQPLYIPELPQVTTAYGAAFLAMESVLHVGGNQYA